MNKPTVIEKEGMEKNNCLLVGIHDCPDCKHINQEGAGTDMGERSWCIHCKKILTDTFPKKI